MKGLASRKSGVTLLELMTVVIIIGILATIALPRYYRAAELTKVREAISTLRQIRHGEIVYRGEENTFWLSSAGPPYNDEMRNIEYFLRVLLDRRNKRSWDYYIHDASPTEFTATANRTSGPHSGRTITINQDGQLGGTWTGPWP